MMTSRRRTLATMSRPPMRYGLAATVLSAEGLHCLRKPVVPAARNTSKENQRWQARTPSRPTSAAALTSKRTRIQKRGG